MTKSFLETIQETTQDLIFPQIFLSFFSDFLFWTSCWLHQRLGDTICALLTPAVSKVLKLSQIHKPARGDKIMVRKSDAFQCGDAVRQLAIPILPIMLLAISSVWASDTQPNKVAVDSSSTPISAAAAATECPPFLFRNSFEPGNLAQPGGVGTLIRYVTGGGYSVQIDLHTITIHDPTTKNKVEHWGTQHENLNGKHIKDWGGADGWDGARRTVVLGDGTKVTMESTGPLALTTVTSIYNGQQNVQIGNSTNTVIHYGVNLADTVALEAAQHDGETSQFLTNKITGVSDYKTIYNEDASFQIVPFNVQLGTSGGCANPNNVNDYFDDPRIGHT